MQRLRCVAFVVVSVVTLAGVTGTNLNVELAVNTTAPVRVVRPTFLSTTIDVSLLINNGQHCNLSSPRLQNMARELTPVWLRIGGTQGDTLWYDMGDQHGEAPPNPGFSRVFNQSTWDTACSFAKDVGMHIAFGINAGPGPRGGLKANGPWNSSNALALMKYSASIGCPLIGYEFGNEPDLFYKFNISGAFVRSCTPPNLTVPCVWSAVPAKTYAHDIATFVSAVKSVNASLLTIAPDVDYIPIIGDFLYLEQLLPAAVGVATWDVTSFHFYPTFAPEHYSKANLPGFLLPLIARPGLLLDPPILNMVGQVATTLRGMVDKYQTPKTELWLGETGSAVGGGAANVSNVFVDGMEWLDKLGQMAVTGVDLVFRQTLCGYRYGFIDFDLNPRPDYFTSVLFKRLVGTSAWNITLTNNDKLLRAYMFSGVMPGSMVAVLVNLHNTTTVQVKLSNSFGVRHDYILTAPDASLTSATILLNGTTLAVAPNGSFPTVAPVVVTNTSLPVTMPPRSYGFAVWPDANVTATADEPLEA